MKKTYRRSAEKNTIELAAALLSVDCDKVSIEYIKPGAKDNLAGFFEITAELPSDE